MKPFAKVMVVVGVVLLAVWILKHWQNRGDVEPYVSWIQQEFETVPPQAFMVTPSPLVVNNALTAVPVLAQVATDLPSPVPTMVPTFVPTTLPTVVMGVVDGDAQVPTARPTLVPTLMPTARPTLAPAATTVPLVPTARPA